MSVVAYRAMQALVRVATPETSVRLSVNCVIPPLRIGPFNSSCIFSRPQ